MILLGIVGCGDPASVPTGAGGADAPRALAGGYISASGLHVQDGTLFWRHLVIEDPRDPEDAPNVLSSLTLAGGEPSERVHGGVVELLGFATVGSDLYYLARLGTGPELFRWTAKGREPIWAGSGRLLFARGDDLFWTERRWENERDSTRLLRMNVREKKIAPVATVDGDVWVGRQGPKELVVATHSIREDSGALWRIDLQTLETRQLAPCAFVWKIALDGAEVVWSQSKDHGDQKRNQILRAGANGPTILLDLPEYHRLDGLALVGKTVFFTEYQPESKSARVASLPLAGGKPSTLLSYDEVGDLIAVGPTLFYVAGEANHEDTIYSWRP